jgi:hypothetical protein
MPDWVAPDDDAIWAPAAARIGDRYVLFFAASAAWSGDTPLKCLGAAVSPSPAGPFAPLPHPLHCTPGYWNIDPYPVTDGQRWYLLWRQDDGAKVTGRIVAARLSPDGLALAGSTTGTLLVGSFSWEEGYADGTPGIGPIENPAMARHPATGEWLLTWSAKRPSTTPPAWPSAPDRWGPAGGPPARHHGSGPARTRASPPRLGWEAPVVLRRGARQRAVRGAARVSWRRSGSRGLAGGVGISGRTLGNARWLSVDRDRAEPSRPGVRQ